MDFMASAKTRLVFFLSCAAALLLALALSAGLASWFNFPIILTAIVFFVFVLLCLFNIVEICNNMARKEPEKLLIKILNTLDPDKYVPKLEKLASFLYSNTGYTILALLALAECLDKKGRPCEAREKLDFALNLTERLYGNPHAVAYYSCLLNIFMCSLMRRHKELENAGQRYREARQCYEKMSPAFKDSMYRSIMNEYIHLSFENGEMPVEEYRRYLIEQLQSAGSPYQQVSIKTRLAELYFNAGDFGEAVEYCKYVLEHGKKLYHFEMAQKMLDSIQKA